jgi:glycosyltransferase involved in cell wall biosynthesis
MKGIFDIPIVLYYILKNIDTKLVITGNFDRTFKEEKIFWKLVDKYNLRDKIIYKGYLGNEELYNEISSSKLLLYPSHGDSFSISIAQALALHTPVVAYDIAGLDIYKQFNAVKFVREFDYKGMAREAFKILKMENTEILFDNSIDKFITEHSWHNVAIQYKNIISHFLNK